MPTRPRIDLAGYHHIINRGVNRCNIFENSFDKEMFLKTLNKTAKLHSVILHDYVLMDNHYHLLIGTEFENLSDFMRILSANYAQYFNKRYSRSGHLWQDRYYSKYIFSSDHLYSLIRYIEYNPIETGMTDKIGEYPFTLASCIFNGKEYFPCANESLLLTEYDMQTLSDYLEAPFTKKELEFLQLKEKQKIDKADGIVTVKCAKKLDEHFKDNITKIDRNFAIVNAYLDGYTQAEISKHLNLSNSLISKIVKSGDSTPGV
jgi:REP element-mobilizing transposase RayT